MGSRCAHTRNHEGFPRKLRAGDGTTAFRDIELPAELRAKEAEVGSQISEYMYKEMMDEASASLRKVALNPTVFMSHMYLREKYGYK